MGAKLKLTEYINIDSVLAQLKELQASKLRVGVIGKEGSTEAMIAGANEFGAEITPKKGKYLALPALKFTKGKSPRDFSDLNFVKNKETGKAYFTRKVNNKDVIYFYLVKKVTIPERSYIRSTLNNPKQLEKPFKFLTNQIEKIIKGESTAKLALQVAGNSLAGQIKTHMVKENIAPPLSGLTRELKGSGHALIDTGRLKNSIGCEVL